MPYVKTTDFAVKDALLTGNPSKVVKGAEIDTEFNNIATANAVNVVGPAGSTNSAVALYDGTTGKLLKDGPLVTTSATDTTAGRLLTVGCFGIGGSRNTLLPDANVWAGQGIYHCAAGSANQPPENTGGADVYCGGDTSFGTQLAVSYASGNVYTRRCSSGTWSAWQGVLAQGQTWQNMTASRALGVNYTNTTGRPIQIKVSCISTVSSVMQTTVSGQTTSSSGNQGSIPSDVTTIPNGADYFCNINAGTPSALNWWELR